MIQEKTSSNLHTSCWYGNNKPTQGHTFNWAHPPINPALLAFYFPHAAIQSFNQSVNQSINQPINPLLNQSILCKPHNILHSPEGTTICGTKPCIGHKNAKKSSIQLPLGSHQVPETTINVSVHTYTWRYFNVTWVGVNWGNSCEDIYIYDGHIWLPQN